MKYTLLLSTSDNMQTQSQCYPSEVLIPLIIISLSRIAFTLNNKKNLQYVQVSYDQRNFFFLHMKQSQDNQFCVK